MNACIGFNQLAKLFSFASMDDSPSFAALELPSDADSLEELEDDDVVVTHALPGQSRCCEYDCLDRIASMPDYQSKVDEIQQALREETVLQKKKEFQFQVLKTWMLEGSGEEVEKKHRRFCFADVPICRVAAASILNSNRSTVTKMTHEVIAGKANASRDLRVGGDRQAMGREESLQVLHAETMWHWIHSFLAEPLAEGLSKQTLDVAVNVKRLLRMDPIAQSFNSAKLEPRHVHPNVTLSELSLG